MMIVCPVPNAFAENGLHGGQFEINVLSSQPYLVSGGSALVGLTVPGLSPPVRTAADSVAASYRGKALPKTRFE
jgi:hypothetical protein